MANEQSWSPLRRWRPFYGAFGAIDDAIEAAAGEHTRAAHRDVRVRILLLLRAADDDDKAEQLCAALDDAMAASLQTLLLLVTTTAPVPPAHRHGAPAASTTDDGLARAAVANLGKHHGSPRIRRLAGDVVRAWKAADTAVKEEEELGKKKLPATAKMLPATDTAGGHEKKLHVPSAKMKMLLLPAAATGTVQEREKKLFVPVKKMLPAATTTVSVSARSEKTEAKRPAVVVAQGEKMEATKRKLREGYEEALKIKRQHVIQKIDDKDASKMFEQSQRKMHRGPARCRISAGGVRRSLLPSLQLV